MVITGKELATAGNVKAAFAKLLCDTKLAQRLRKNMGLGDTLGPLPVEFGGTGGTGISYLERGFSHAVGEYARASNEFAIRQAILSDDSKVSTLASRYFPIDDHTLVGLSDSYSSPDAKIGVNIYDIDAFLKDGRTNVITGTFSFMSLSSVSLVAANGKRNDDGSVTIWAEYTAANPIVEVHDVTLTVSSNGSVSGSAVKNTAHGALAKTIDCLAPRDSIAFFQNESGTFATVATPKRDSIDYGDSKVYFFECSPNGAFSFYSSTVDVDYQDFVWPCIDDGRAFYSEGVCMSYYETLSSPLNAKIMAIDVDGGKVSVHTFDQSSFQDARGKNWFVGTGFAKAQKAVFAMPKDWEIIETEVSKSGVESGDSVLPFVSIGSLHTKGLKIYDFYFHDGEFGKIIFVGDYNQPNENIYLEKYGAFFEVSGHQRHSRVYAYEGPYAAMTRGRRVFLVGKRVESGHHIKIAGF